jgi:hypothetical protein
VVCGSIDRKAKPLLGGLATFSFALPRYKHVVGLSNAASVVQLSRLHSHYSYKL